MKKEFAAGKKVCILIMTIVSFLAWGQSAQNVYATAGRQAEIGAETVKREVLEEAGGAAGEVPEDAEAEEKRLMKVIPLKSDRTTQIPKYIVEENITYVLDESSIVVEETQKGTSEGANVVTVSRKVEKLPDNDLERIEKTMLHEGIICDLLSVVYEVEKEDEYGIPTQYSAACEYGGLKKYSNSYPIAWQMTVWYDIYKAGDEADAMAGREEYEYIHIPTEYKTGTETDRKEAEMTQDAENSEEEEVFLPKPEITKIRVKQVPEEESKREIADIAVPLAAAAGAGVTLPFIVWFSIVTAPVFAMKKDKRYRYIGRIRLKKEEGMYTAYLTKRLLARAEIPVFMIKLSEKVRKKTKAGMLQIHCPDGKRILLTVGKEVGFTVEGEGV